MEERDAGSVEVRGSNPLSSTSRTQQALHTSAVPRGRVGLGISRHREMCALSGGAGLRALQSEGESMGRLARALFLIAAASVLFLSADRIGLASSSDAEKPDRRVAIVTVSDVVDYGLVKFVDRAVGQAREFGATHIVFELDTPGGYLDSAYDLHHMLLILPGETGAKTIAYVKRKALSAGAVFALSCRELVMNAGSRIGDVEPILVTGEGIQEAGEKYESDLRTVFRTNAQTNGYPERLSEAMVSRDMQVLEVKYNDGSVRYLEQAEFDSLPAADAALIDSHRVVVPRGKLLTMTSKEAVAYGFAKKEVQNRQEVLNYYGLEGVPSVVLGPNWSEELVRLLQKYSVILLAIGLLAAYLEFKTPGFGVWGSLAILCLGLFFGGKYLAGLANAVEILVFLIGVALVAIEIFLIPGFGMVGILGILCIMVSIYLGSVKFTIPRSAWEFQRFNVWAWQFSAAMGGAVVVAAALARFLPRTPLLKRIILTASESVSEGYTASTVARAGLLGATGVAVTKLRPAGKAEIGGKVRDVMTQGELVDAGEKVEVIDVRGNRIMVRPSVRR